MISPRAWPRAVVTIARTFGLRGAALRAAYELRRRHGRFRYVPSGASTRGPDSPSPFKVNRRLLVEAIDQSHAVYRGDRVVSGEHEAYRWEWRSLPKDADAWRRNSATGHEYPRDWPWWRIPHLDADAGDIKDVWEPARFGWTFDLVRAYLLTGDDRYVLAFRKYFDAWCDSSLPFRGVHWSCGQETAIRAIALLYAEANLSGSPALAAADQQKIVAVLGASGERIADAIGYAISQRNNHAISEAVGLVAVGVRLRGVHPEAEEWISRGSRWLARLIPEQFEDDGWYVQHSFTYLRLALDQCIVAERALRSLGRGLPRNCVRRLKAATELLIAVADSTSGIVPNHGANDGAFVHPITSAAYRDFRPVITAAASLFDVAIPSNLAPDRETLAWLGTQPPRTQDPAGDGVITGSSGWAAMRVGRLFAFLRAGKYASRPSHLDPLQLDVRLDGRELVVDPGTFAYQAPPPWRNGLVTARVHNGPLVDDEEPGVRGPRFLWYAWPEARLLSASYAEGRAIVEAEVPGRVIRRVAVDAESVTIEDRAVSAAEGRRMVVRWLRHPAAPDDVILSDPPFKRIPAREDHPLGWFSPHYGQRIPSVAFEIDVPSSNGLRVITRIRPEPLARGEPVNSEASSSTATTTSE